MTISRLSEYDYHWRRTAFAIVRFLAALGWPLFFVRAMYVRFEKIYRFVRFKTRASRTQQ
jgi:hypothetical protein